MKPCLLLGGAAASTVGQGSQRDCGLEEEVLSEGARFLTVGMPQRERGVGCSSRMGTESHSSVLSVTSGMTGRLDRVREAQAGTALACWVTLPAPSPCLDMCPPLLELVQHLSTWWLPVSPAWRAFFQGTTGSEARRAPEGFGMLPGWLSRKLSSWIDGGC